MSELEHLILRKKNLYYLSILGVIPLGYLGKRLLQRPAVVTPLNSPRSSISSISSINSLKSAYLSPGELSSKTIKFIKKTPIDGILLVDPVNSILYKEKLESAVLKYKQFAEKQQLDDLYAANNMLTPVEEILDLQKFHITEKQLFQKYQDGYRISKINKINKNKNFNFNLKQEEQKINNNN